MDVSRMPKEGDRFGNWVIERTLDRGGMGMVYLAYNPDLGKSEKVALKVLDPAVAEKNADFVKRFYQEASIVFKTHCPHLVSIHDAGRDAASGFYYIVMEFLGGGTLRDRMRKQGRMPWREALSIIRPVALALAAVAKRKSVHRDIKPENIMFTADGEVKLADFGIAKAVQDDTENMLKTMPAQVFGTPAYMSPEQIKDASSVDARADIWSLGVVLFEMLAGARPYPAKNVVEVAAFLLSPKPFPDIRVFKAPAAHVPAQQQTAVTMAVQSTTVTQPTVATQATRVTTMSGSPNETATPPAQELRPEVPEGVAELLSRMCDKNLRKRIATSEDVVAAIDRLLGQTTASGPHGNRKMLRIVCAGLSLFLIALCVFALMRKPEVPHTRDHGSFETNAVSSPKPLESDPIAHNQPATNPSPPRPVVPSSVLFQPQRGTIDEVLMQLDQTIGRNPIHLMVSLSTYAQKKELSIERFEQQLLVPAIERLRTSGVSFSLVPGSGRYGAAVRDAAKQFSCNVE